ncbi:MAG: hypothetical protein OXB86_04650 [Bdellovibrionales bacterium]|nr:hypothetical protein [Bdellovibrionales bacterium]
MRFATKRLTAAIVSKPNSFLTPIDSHEGLVLCKRKTSNFKPGSPGDFPISSNIQDK